MNNSHLFSIAVALVAVLQFLGTETAHCAEKKAVEDISVDAMTHETQKTVGSSQDELNLVWVIPSEFWQISLAQDDDLPAFQRRLLLNELDKYLIIGVVRADISPLGAFHFHDERAVFDGLRVAYVTGDGKRLPLKPQRQVDDDAQLIIDSMKPILGAAMGKMGDNFHLFACDNNAGREGTRISAYDLGTVAVTLDEAGKNVGGTAEVAFPLDSLYVPRKCPKCAKHAHISWSYCPWCGTRHDE